MWGNEWLAAFQSASKVWDKVLAKQERTISAPKQNNGYKTSSWRY